jgi:polyribonucleotide nucleotidyltransferase
MRRPLMEKKIYSLEIGGKTMTAEFNDWADQANGSVLLRYGNSAVLATVVMGSRIQSRLFPALRRIRREVLRSGRHLRQPLHAPRRRPSDEAVLSGRIVDRTIRPLFPKGFKRDVQVIITVLSLEDYDPDVLAVNAASLASPHPTFRGTAPSRRCASVKNSKTKNFIVNPTYKERDERVPKATWISWHAAKTDSST